MNNLSNMKMSPQRVSIGPLILRNPSYINCKKANSNESIDSSVRPLDSEQCNKAILTNRQSRVQSLYSYLNISKKGPSKNLESNKCINNNSQSIPNFMKMMKSKAIINKFISNLFKNSYILPTNQKHLLYEEYLPQDQIFSNTASFHETPTLIQIFQPGNQLLFCWDLIGITVNLLSLWLSPFEAAFNTSNHFSLQIIIVLYLFLDILFNLNRSAISVGEIINTRSLIIKHYFKGSAIYDIISLGIWIYIFNAPQEYFILETLQIVQIIVTMKKIHQSSDQLFESLYSKGIFSNLIDLLTLIISIFFFAHIMACLWYYVGRKSDLLLGHSWLEKYNIEQETVLIKYNYSIYWATTTIVTVGYGDITPQNQIEMIFATIMMFFSSCVYAYSLNSIGIILKNIQDSKQQYKRMLLRINNYMNQNKVQFELQLRVRNFLKFHLFENEQQEHQEEINNIMQKLPEALKEQVNKNIQLKILSQITLLQDLFSSSTVMEISKFLETVYLTPNDVLYQQNEKCEPFLYFVFSGQIQLYEEYSKKILAHINSGQKFGEYQFFTGLYPKCSAKCTKDTVLYKISRDKLLSIIQYCQKDFQRFHNIKDKILLYNDYSKCFSSCQICKKYNHEVIECPCLTYQPNLEQRIKRDNYHQIKNRRGNAKRTTTKIHCLSIHHKIEISIKGYQEQNNESIVQLSDFQYGKGYKTTFEEQEKKVTLDQKSRKNISERDITPYLLSSQRKRKQTFRPSIIPEGRQLASIFQMDFKSTSNNIPHSSSSNNEQQQNMLSDIQIALLSSNFHIDEVMEFKEYMPNNNVISAIKQAEKGSKKTSRKVRTQMKDLDKITFFYYVKIMTLKIKRTLMKNQDQPWQTESYQVRLD